MATPATFCPALKAFKASSAPFKARPPLPLSVDVRNEEKDERRIRRTNEKKSEKKKSEEMYDYNQQAMF